MTPFELLGIVSAIGATLAAFLYWCTRPEPAPSTLEEDIVRRAIAKINWRRRPSNKTQSKPFNPGALDQGMLVVIPFDHSNSVKLLFTEGKVVIGGSNEVQIELAAPDSLDRLAGAIERAWAQQYR